MPHDAVEQALRIAKVHTGPIVSRVAGRTDHHPIDVPPESYVIPADVVSGLGEGNTLNGMEIIKRMFGLPDKPQQKLAAGGVPVVVAGGEVVLPPDVVAKAGGGDIKRGHKVLSAWVKRERAKTIKTLKSLPSPHK